MKLAQYFKNLSLLFFINFAVKPIWVFAIDRKFQLALGKEAYGQYFEFLYLIYIFALVLDLGLHNFTVKSVAEWKENYKKTKQNKTIFISPSLRKDREIIKNNGVNRLMKVKQNGML